MDIEERIQRIDDVRHVQGLSIQQLADMCHISKSTVSRTLAGKTAPTEYTLRAMEESLGITDSEIGDNIMAPYANDPIVERYLNTQENRIVRLRAFYNRELAEKDRWIHLLLYILLLLVILMILICLFMESPL